MGSRLFSKNKMTENKLFLDKHILIIDKDEIDKDECEQFKKFCGIIYNDINDIDMSKIDSTVLVYLAGNIESFALQGLFEKECTIYIINEYSHSYEHLEMNNNVINLGEVPMNIHNVGIFFNNFFGHKDYFKAINDEHEFQNLTESTKPGNAYRKGIYMTTVTKKDDVVNFNLLRCSTNFEGPTDNFRTTDNEIIISVNKIASYFFEQKVTMNHVLAQIYNNAKVGLKEKKAKIKEHSDKTKDMPRNALMAFCTFYDTNNDTNNDTKNDTVLTKLRFRLKDTVKDSQNLVKEFDIILRPNSLFLMSLTTNRLYTHEIVPSILPIDKIPTRMGYVIRCSCTEAVFKDGHTFIKDSDGLVALEKCTEKDINDLKQLYYKENTSDELITYDKLFFSMNEGDYKMPIA